MALIEPSELEISAQSIMKATLALAVEHYDDQSAPKMPDLMVFQDDQEIPAEVTEAVDQKIKRHYSALSQYGSKISAPNLVSPWHVALRFGARIRDLVPALPLLLKALELCNIKSVSMGLMPIGNDVHIDGIITKDSLPFILELLRMGVIQAIQTPEAGDVSEIYLMSQFVGGSVENSADSIVHWLPELFALPSVVKRVRKLSDWGGTESHLFVWISEFTDAPWDVIQQIRSDGLPKIDPELPNSVTNLWVVHSREQKGVAWISGKGWVRVRGAEAMATTDPELEA